MLSKVVLIFLCLALAEANLRPNNPSKDGGLNTIFETKESHNLSKECVEENWALIEEQRTNSKHNLLSCHFFAIVKELVQIPFKSFKPNIVLFKDLVGIILDIWDCRHLAGTNVETCVFKKSIDAIKKAMSLFKIMFRYETWYIRLRNNIEECFGLGQREHQRFEEFLRKTSVKCQ